MTERTGNLYSDIASVLARWIHAYPDPNRWPSAVLDWARDTLVLLWDAMDNEYDPEPAESNFVARSYAWIHWSDRSADGSYEPLCAVALEFAAGRLLDVQDGGVERSLLAALSEVSAGLVPAEELTFLAEALVEGPLPAAGPLVEALHGVLQGQWTEDPSGVSEKLLRKLRGEVGEGETD